MFGVILVDGEPGIRIGLGVYGAEIFFFCFIGEFDVGHFNIAGLGKSVVKAIGIGGVDDQGGFVGVE